MLDEKGLEAAKAVFNKTYVEKDGPLKAAITAYLKAVGPEPVAQISDELVDTVREAYRRKVAEYDRDFRDPAMSGELWKTKYGTNLHSTSLGEQWAMSQALRSALVATPPAEPVVEATRNAQYICDRWEKSQGASSLTIAVRSLLAALAAKDGRS